MTHELQSQPAAASGDASVLRAQPAVLRATIHVTRAATGKVDTYELVGTAVPYGVQLPKKEPA